MFARVSILKGDPATFDESTKVVREQVLPAARDMEGFAGILVLGDRSTGKSLAITLWQTEEARKASEEAADRLRADSAAEAGEEIVAVERYEVILEERG